MTDFNAVLSAMIVNAVKEGVATLQPEKESICEHATIKGIRGLAAYLGISSATAQRLKNEGKIPYSRIGNRVYFVPSQVDNAIKVNTNEL